jgi:hypothetical protein
LDGSSPAPCALPSPGHEDPSHDPSADPLGDAASRRDLGERLEEGRETGMVSVSGVMVLHGVSHSREEKLIVDSP